MITIKTPQEIELMRQGGKILARILKEVAEMVKPGVSTAELDEYAEKRIKQFGGKPSFKNYKADPHLSPFPTSLCISINNEVVHAPALPSRIFKEGDLVGFDLGLEYQGYFTDMAVTVGIGKISKEAKKLLNITQEALKRGIKAVRAGNFISDISQAIQEFVEAKGFGIVRDLAGHGVGKTPHEEPRIYNFIESGQEVVELKEGMTLAIEPMVVIGSGRVKILEDDWTIATREGGLAAHFEHTIVVTKKGAEILTL